jgi:PII-like signaling protein
VRELHAVTDGFSLAEVFSRSPSNHETMKDHHIVTREIGKIRIYLTPRDRTPPTGFWDRFNAKPVYREIIKAAKTDGLSNAAAFMTHFGFSNGGKVQTEGAELPNPNLTICVELIDHKDKLEEFCRKHGALLKGKTVVYKHVEHWDIRSGELVERDASPNEILDGAAKIKPKVS